MKLKKLLASMLAVVATLALTVGLAACGGGDNDNDNDTDKDGDKVTISYQYTGVNDELASYNWAYTVMLNLWSDGTVSGSGYNYLKEEGGLKEKWFRGSWVEKNDEDAGKYVQLKAIWDEDATNDMSGGTSTAGRLETYSLYFDDDGKTLLPFTLKIPLMSERNAEMTCHVPAIYADIDAFVQGSKDYAANLTPDDGGDEEDYGTAIATLKSEDDREAVFYDSGVVVIDANYAHPVLEWKYENNAFTFTEADGDKKGQVTTAATLTVDETTGTLTYSLTGAIAFTYTGDVSKLIGAEEEATIVATLTTAEGGYTATFFSDGKVKVTTSMAQLSPEWNWAYANGEISLTEASGSTPGGVTFSISETTGTLVYAPSFLQGASITYTGDISALIA